jgi:hypothetical protein
MEKVGRDSFAACSIYGFLNFVEREREGERELRSEPELKAERNLSIPSKKLLDPEEKRSRSRVTLEPIS